MLVGVTVLGRDNYSAICNIMSVMLRRTPSGIFVVAVIRDVLRWTAHSGHDILCVNSMEGGKKSQRYHGRAQEVHRSGQSRSSGRVACAKA